MQRNIPIKVSDKFRTIEYLGRELNEESAVQLASVIRQFAASQPKRPFSLLLNEVKSMEVGAASVLADLSDIEVDADALYLMDYAEFGFEQLSAEVALVLAKLPSYFLVFDQISILPESVACQFIGSSHALAFNGCSEFSPAALRALAKSACFLSIGLSELSIEQAEALANFNYDLMLRAEKLQPDVLHALGENPNLCFAPHYGVIRLAV